jgi:Leucine-rich repeat (LRR) protein
MTRNLKWSLFVGVVFLAAAGTYVYWQYIRDTWQPPAVVTIASEKELASLFPAYMTWMSVAEEGAPQALLLRDGDYIFGEVLVPYRASDGPTPKIIFTDWSASIGDTTIALSLDEKDGRKWLNSASDQQLARLRMVAVPADLDAGTLAAIKRISAANPNVDLTVESDGTLRLVLPLFKPRAVFAGGEDMSSLAILANQPQLETLLISASKPGSLDNLPSLPRLRRLVLGDWKIAEAGPLPEGLSGLQSLVVVRSDMKDLSALRALPAGIEELSLQNSKELEDVTGLDKLTELRALSLWSDDDESSVPLPDLVSLRKLRWMCLPPQISQAQLAAFANAHPNLMFLQLPKTEHPIDLTPLRGMKDLQGLVLGGTYENLELLREFTSLRYIGVSEKIWDDSSAQIAAIRKALPDAVVVRVSPICLGSGWILLLVPVLGFAWLRRRSLPLVRQAA